MSGGLQDLRESGIVGSEFPKRMLTFLSIKNLALVDHLTWEIGNGLVGVTGETGAGKSIIVGALKLVLGERAERNLIRTGESTCTVEAVFQLADTESVSRILEETGAEECEEGQLVIKRVIGEKGGKQFVNSSAVTLGVLKELGRHLVDLHGPHDHQSLLSQDRQLKMLDAYAGIRNECQRYEAAWTTWQGVLQRLAEAKETGQASLQEVDLLRFQVEEIERAGLTADDEEGLSTRYQRVSNATRLVELGKTIAEFLNSDDGGVLAQLHDMQRAVRELERLDPSTSEITTGLDATVIELEEFGTDLQNHVEALKLDSQELIELENRVELVEGLKRKYGATVEEIIAHHDRTAERLERINNSEEFFEELKQEADKTRKAVEKIGAKISNQRRRFAPQLAKEISLCLTSLGFQKCAFEVSLTQIAEPMKTGLEGVSFLFCPNPGEPLKPLREIASSGEISRVMLAVKSSLAEQDAIPLMVFDEIDANVGGEIARAVGEKMMALGKEHQVVAITHFPQVAAVAKEHFVVEKVVRSGRTFSTLRSVKGEKRVAELVRMLGGGGSEVQNMAQSLLSSSS